MYSLVLIEDEPLTLNLLASLIQWEKYGFMLLEKFEDSKAALEFIKARKPDLVISDIKMPKVSGLEIAKYCFENFKETHVALISAYRDFEYAKQAIKYAVKDYIEKPVNMKEMINLLENYKKEHPKSMHIPDDEDYEGKYIKECVVPGIAKKANDDFGDDVLIPAVVKVETEN